MSRSLKVMVFAVSNGQFNDICQHIGRDTIFLSPWLLDDVRHDVLLSAEEQAERTDDIGQQLVQADVIVAAKNEPFWFGAAMARGVPVVILDTVGHSYPADCCPRVVRCSAFDLGETLERLQDRRPGGVHSAGRAGEDGDGGVHGGEPQSPAGGVDRPATEPAADALTG